MWRSLWPTIDRFSLHHFRYIVNQLREIRVVDKRNREVVLDLLQSIVEIVTYGDRHDPAIFECFMEFQVLAEFVRILKIGGNSGIEAALLQYLSIMIQNVENEHAIYYCFSNGYINSVISHHYEFDGGDLIPYYVSFLRTVSGKIGRDTICLLVKVHQDTAISLPLYDEALKFANHGEKMIQIAVRALTLNIYSVADEMVYQFLTTPTASAYFSSLILNLKNKCLHVDAIINGVKESFHEKKRELLSETDRILDDFYYLKDILCIPEQRLNKLVTENIVNMLILPMLLTLLNNRLSNDTGLSAITCLYVLCRLLQVFDGTNLVNVIGSAVLFSFMPPNVTDAAESVVSARLEQVNGLAVCYQEGEEMVDLQHEGAENFMMNYVLKHSLEFTELSSCFDSSPLENSENEWGGIFSCIFSRNHSLMLGSLMLLFTVADSKDLHYQLAAKIGFSQVKTASEMIGSTVAGHIQKIVNQLLKVLASEPPLSVPILLHAAWFLRKLLVFLDQKLEDNDCHLFKTSYEGSCGRLYEEFDRCWFDYIPDVLKSEWANCKTALEESSQSKDPFFLLELASIQNPPSGSNTGPAFDWQRMVDCVKVFVLHLQLKPFIFGGDPFDNPLANLKNSYLAQSGKRYPSDLSLASFGSEVALGSGIPCKIAFSGAGTRDIYVIPIAREISGKLLLVERHPLHSRKGVVIAIAPLAGLDPKIDEEHPTWLLVHLRDFEPRLRSDETKTLDSHTSLPEQGRWILGFLSAKDCKAAFSVILEETRKQRSFVENLVAPVLEEKLFK
ncbi:protein TRANSPARENT TESTA 9-like isoform X3 [Coffea eugenioides]|uniref:Protein TRANSPARENT TESTA 9-like isoform X3 n=2 Tax=Coffea arabica TaxID=13443 RepID=A0A6P6SRF2_COFAR|nr:protein TRANSPARENT TESTA 9-like isoform X3 [Coffea arabica]XP_027175488.1 protein TRANSPARENT TESTA 9-like isoform X3 [Coffea eugenioides]